MKFYAFYRYRRFPVTLVEKKFCGLRNDILRRHKFRISESVSQSLPSTPKFSDRNVQFLALFLAEFFTTLTSDEKKKRVNYVCGINKSCLKKKNGRWRTKICATGTKKGLWKCYEQCCYAKLLRVSVVNRSKLYKSTLNQTVSVFPRQNSS